jgi:hypothetical protein
VRDERSVNIEKDDKMRVKFKRRENNSIDILVEDVK